MLLEKLDGVTPQLLDTSTVPELHMDDTTTNTGKCLRFLASQPIYCLWGFFGQSQGSHNNGKP